ncbi:ATP-binding protein [Streptomyces decoyicus]|uniref:ATP-binding protein n=1 Tax=Streptomyces decoyicus TaxID=249567 RepID=UPI002E1951EB
MTELAQTAESDGIDLYVWDAGGRDTAGAARAVLCAALVALRLPAETVEDAVLAGAELVANACEHARGPYRLRLRATAREYICEVHDRSRHLPSMPTAPAAEGLYAPDEADRGGGLDALCAVLAERGRGLLIVQRVSGGCMGARRTATGKCVWFAIPTAGHAVPCPGIHGAAVSGAGGGCGSGRGR